MQKKVFNFSKIILSLFIIFMASSCQTNEQSNVPKIVPGVEIKREVKHPLGIIGEVEPVYILPMKSPFPSRIDTGAQSSSIDVDNQKVFERDGKKWVAFDIINRETNEKHHFEKRIEEIKKIKRINESEERISVVMDIRIGDQTIKEIFSLARRDKFNYQVLIGRDVLTGRAIIDPAIKNTLK